MNEDAAHHHQAPVVTVEIRAPIAVVRINHPAERNALSVSTLEELNAIVSALISRADVGSIIFTGTNDVFASGANIRELSMLTPATAREFARRGQLLFRKIADASQQTIAAVNGYCMGGGLDLALACDYRCASPDAVFAHPGARLGVITGWGGTQRLPRLIGEAHAIEMFTTAKRLTSSEAYEIGLIDRISDDFLMCSYEIARERAVNSKHLK